MNNALTFGKGAGLRTAPFSVGYITWSQYEVNLQGSAGPRLNRDAISE